jgi:5-methylcytosine-specific restriction endonuclease McrA
MVTQPFDYAAYRRSAAWQCKRVRVIRRCGGICERCGLWPATVVHHLTYERIGEERDEDLQGVCIKCHAQLHEEEI